MAAPATTKATLRIKFFSYLFGDDEGIICISSSAPDKGGFHQRFFRWPEDANAMDAAISERAKKANVWFCTSLLSKKQRLKEACLPGRIVWADLDYMPNTETIDPKPSLLIESSNQRYQAYWRFEEVLPPDVQEDFSRRLAYHLDADKSGWDLTQLLRVPYTYNHKYPVPPEIKIKFAYETFVPVGVMDQLPDLSLPQDAEILTEEMPDPDTLPDPESVIYSYRLELRDIDAFAALYTQNPPQEADWSKLLWRLIRICFEVGMTREEAFAVAIGSACNKYKRDNRPLSYLWRDVIKADLANTTATALSIKGHTKLVMPQLVDNDDVKEDSLIADYKKWGDLATDAPIVYHELGCFIALSSVVCTGLKLATSFTQSLVPNLWGLVLGESTLTRKTTCMNMVRDIILDLDPESIIASADGSVEGLLTGLSARPSRISIYYRDEVAGMFQAMNTKQYLADMPETLTQLYDVPRLMRRPLRKDTITIMEPYFIFFGGGIKDQFYSLVTQQHVLSGFLPRFLVVCGENDLDRIRPTGPPRGDVTKLKQKVMDRFIELKDLYSLSAPIEVGGQQMMQPIRYDAVLDDDAWEYYGELEMKLVHAASESPMQMLALPTFQRLALSMLKMSMLIAATRREPDNDYKLEVTKDDIKQAAWYIQRWGHYSVDLIANSGRPNIERILDKIITYISLNQNCLKSDLMQAYHLTAREAKEALETLSERGLIVTHRIGKGVRLSTVV